ncbi:tripartite tricarboxylate transporter substrate binding protein [Bordetella sp. LUAb4]|uniref:Bug family tripartite tricarboxylate transporter substrate binding protein n=1 Tax=Bordetella sp. LUAb4 TaxID=2843195 RepID=UPI001E4877B2|nr:tripartite tricarboxylate transporter substrate binding protein [Bordetella sp. LUAb4]
MFKVLGKFGRKLPGLALCAVGLLGAGHAQAAYPDRPVRVIVPFAAGGGADIVARLVFKGVSEQLGKAFIIDNRGGAGGIIGTDAVAKADADGYTLLLGQSGPNAINPSVYSKLPYDARKDFAPVTQLTRYPYVIAARKTLPVDNLKELIALAKRQPGTLTVSTAGQGSSAHLAIELFMRQAGISINAVPYKGAGPALLDVVGGVVDLTFGDAASASKQAQAKNVKALAVTGAKRSPLIPDVPTVAEAGVPGYEASAWHAVLAPRGTPEAIVHTLQEAIAKVLADPALKARLAEDGIETVGSSPEEFNRALQAEIEKWHQVVVEANIKLE